MTALRGTKDDASTYQGTLKRLGDAALAFAEDIKFNRTVTGGTDNDAESIINELYDSIAEAIRTSMSGDDAIRAALTHLRDRLDSIAATNANQGYAVATEIEAQAGYAFAVVRAGSFVDRGNIPEGWTPANDDATLAGNVNYSVNLLIRVPHGIDPEIIAIGQVRGGVVLQEYTNNADDPPTIWAAITIRTPDPRYDYYIYAGEHGSFEGVSSLETGDSFDMRIALAASVGQLEEQVKALEANIHTSMFTEVASGTVPGAATAEAIEDVVVEDEVNIGFALVNPNGATFTNARALLNARVDSVIEVGRTNDGVMGFYCDGSGRLFALNTNAGAMTFAVWNIDDSEALLSAINGLLGLVPAPGNRGWWISRQPGNERYHYVKPPLKIVTTPWAPGQTHYFGTMLPYKSSWWALTGSDPSTGVTGADYEPGNESHGGDPVWTEIELSLKGDGELVAYVMALDASNSDFPHLGELDISDATQTFRPNRANPEFSDSGPLAVHPVTGDLYGLIDYKLWRFDRGTGEAIAIGNRISLSDLQSYFDNLNSHDQVQGLAFSPDGKLHATIIYGTGSNLSNRSGIMEIDPADGSIVKATGSSDNLAGGVTDTSLIWRDLQWYHGSMWVITDNRIGYFDDELTSVTWNPPDPLIANFEMLSLFYDPNNDHLYVIGWSTQHNRWELYRIDNVYNGETTKIGNFAGIGMTNTRAESGVFGVMDWFGGDVGRANMRKGAVGFPQLTYDLQKFISDMGRMTEGDHDLLDKLGPLDTAFDVEHKTWRTEASAANEGGWYGHSTSRSTVAAVKQGTFGLTPVLWGGQHSNVGDIQLYYRIPRIRDITGYRLSYEYRADDDHSWAHKVFYLHSGSSLSSGISGTDIVGIDDDWEYRKVGFLPNGQIRNAVVQSSSERLRWVGDLRDKVVTERNLSDSVQRDLAEPAEVVFTEQLHVLYAPFGVGTESQAIQLYRAADHRDLSTMRRLYTPHPFHLPGGAILTGPEITGLTVDPTTGEFYFTWGDENTNNATAALYRLDPFTGEGERIGNASHYGVSALTGELDGGNFPTNTAIVALGFRPNGQILASFFCLRGGHEYTGVLEVDKTTGAATSVLQWSRISANTDRYRGLVVDEHNVVYAAGQHALYTITEGNRSQVATWGTGLSLTGLAYSPFWGVMMGMFGGGSSIIEGPSSLRTWDATRKQWGSAHNTSLPGPNGSAIAFSHSDNLMGNIIKEPYGVLIYDETAAAISGDEISATIARTDFDLRANQMDARKAFTSFTVIASFEGQNSLQHIRRTVVAGNIPGTGIGNAAHEYQSPEWGVTELGFKARINTPASALDSTVHIQLNSDSATTAHVRIYGVR